VTTLARWITGAVAILILLAGCAADRLHREGLVAIDKGDYEAGVAKLTAAVQGDPRNMGYRLDLAARREAAVEKLISVADSARAAGQIDVAAQTFRRVLALDPANDRAHRGLAALEGDARHGVAVAAARKDFARKDYDSAEAQLRAVLTEDPGFKPAQELTAEITVARGPTAVAPRLKTRENRKVTLQFRDAPTKMVFEVLSRETGINFILDKDIKSDGKTTIFVQDVPVEDAIDLVLDQNALTRQILAANMVLIYPNNPLKQKEYQEEIVHTFYVTNAAPKDVEGMLKTVLGAKTLFVDERAGVVVMRDIPDAIRMAEKLVASLDVAEPEVMLEVEVLEIQKSRLQDLGIAYPTTATLTPSPLTAGSTGGLVLSDLTHQNSNTIGITPLSVTLNALKQAGLTNTLASPRIRARNREKAKILIGQREPVITNSVTPTAAGTPVVTGSVQYLDVGLTLEVQPTVYLDSDVAIKVNLEVSSILKQITTASGTIAYEIGTRNANTLLRLKDGETQILAGLIQDTDTRTTNSIPGLGDIPILGKLFGTNHTDIEKDEIVLSITPRIIRMQPRPPSDATEFWYGTETRTRAAPFTSGTDSADSTGGAPSGRGTVTNGMLPPAAASSTTAIQQSAPMPSAIPVTPPPPAAPQGMPIAAPPAALAANPAAAGAAPSPDSAAAGPGPTVPPAAAVTIEGPAEVHVGDEFQVVVHLSTQEEITRLRSQVRFDPTALQLVSANPGDVVPAGAGGPTVNARAGGAQLEVITTPDDPVHGEGGLMVMRFKALGPRSGTSIAAMLSVIGGSGAAVGTGSATPLSVVVEP
jgi:general secretion pathway protein D